MHQTRNSVISIPVVITLILGVLAMVPFALGGNSLAFQVPMADTDFEYDGEPQEAGINRFYTSEYKRLPFYDFGLGKRFDSGDPESAGEYGGYLYGDEEDAGFPELDLYHEDNMQTIGKRQLTPYNFGLGKRNRYDFGLGKRRADRYDFGLGKRRADRYDFGLGKRSPASRRDKVYNMGLGKRIYSFGLGKRPYGHQSPAASRFNFGLGKRSEDQEGGKDNAIAKREVRTKSLTAEDGNAARGEGKLGKSNRIPEGTGRREERTKRTVEKGPAASKKSPDGFLRQFRKPVYSFGLGKRTSSKTHLPNVNSFNN